MEQRDCNALRVRADNQSIGIQAQQGAEVPAAERVGISKAQREIQAAARPVGARHGDHFNARHFVGNSLGSALARVVSEDDPAARRGVGDDTVYCVQNVVSHGGRANGDDNDQVNCLRGHSHGTASFWYALHLGALAVVDILQRHVKVAVFEQ